MPHVLLVGMWGAGKTTVGKRLARHLQGDFVDQDDWIESQLATSINSSIQEHRDPSHLVRRSEELAPAFRAFVRAQESSLVVAMGGLFVLSACWRETMLETFPDYRIHLDVSVEGILHRLRSASPPHRLSSFMAGDTQPGDLRGFERHRRGYFELMKTDTVPTDGSTVEEVSARVVAILGLDSSLPLATP